MIIKCRFGPIQIVFNSRDEVQLRFRSSNDKHASLPRDATIRAIIRFILSALLILYAFPSSFFSCTHFRLAKLLECAPCTHHRLREHRSPEYAFSGLCLLGGTYCFRETASVFLSWQLLCIVSQSRALWPYTPVNKTAHSIGCPMAHFDASLHH